MAGNAIATTLARHRAFWGYGVTDRPLVGVTRWSQVSARQFDWGLPESEGALEPAMLRVEHFLPQYEALYRRWGPLDGDLVWPAMPPTAIPWLEAMLGCPIRYSLASSSFFAEPLPGNHRFDADLPRLAANSWFAKLLEFVDGLARLSGGRFAVGLPLTRGPWDMAAAARGTTELYLGLYDRPIELARLAGVSADLWIRVTRRLAAAIPRWHGGYVSFLGIWGPTFNPMPQDDASVSVSADLYRRVMGEADRRVTRAWKRPIFHLHSAGLQVLDNVLGMLDGRALNVDIDPAGPSIDAILPALRRVQSQRVPLHLLVFDPEQARTLARGLAPAGLAVTYQPLDPATARSQRLRVAGRV